MPKVIVINDVDGHVLALEWNAENAKAAIEGCIMANGVSEFMDDDEVDDLVDTLDRCDGSQGWLDLAAEIIQLSAGTRTHGNKINVLEAEGSMPAEDIAYSLS
jgi:hypothetical protein